MNSRAKQKVHVAYTVSMKTLSKEERVQQDLRLYSVGICENIREEHLGQLMESGEWLEAQDEIVVADQTEQKFLYILVEGEVEIFKFREGVEPGSPNERQVFSTLGAATCFGEMAFLSAGVASANVSARGRAVLWRMSHEMLLNFVENCKGGSQLVLNIAASLSGRVQEGNRRLLEVTDRIGTQIHRLKEGGEGNLEDMEQELNALMKAYQGMEASQKEEDLKPLLVAAAIGVGGLLFGAWKFFEKPAPLPVDPAADLVAPASPEGH